jgi:hypothetical protein
MAEAAFDLIVSTGTPVLNGYGTKPDDPGTSPVSEAKVTLSHGPTSPVPRSGRTLDWQELYPEQIGRSALLVRALTLLAEGEKSLIRARDYIVDEDIISADYEVTLFQGAIPELFCCQSIGEGFAAIVVALRWALKNRKGAPLNLDQLNAVLNCVRRLRAELFLKYETALDLIEALEALGLNTEISIAEPLATLLIEETDQPHQ